MRLKVIVILMFLIFSLSGTLNICMAEPGTATTGTEQTGTMDKRLMNDLTSEDDAVRERAIDEFVTQFTTDIEQIIKESKVGTNSEMKEQDEQIRSMLVEAFQKYSEKHKEKLKTSLSQILDNPDTREIIAPFFGVIMEMIKTEMKKELNKVTEEDKENNK